MNRFLIRVLQFIAPIIISIICLDAYLRNINSLYLEKHTGLIKNKDSIEILILGNSHANYGVDPNQFTKFTFNTANPAQSIYFDKRITLNVLDSLSELKFVFISIDYHSLYFSSQEKGIRDVWSYYAHGIKYKDKNYLKENISPFLFGYTPKVSLSMIKNRLISLWINKNHETIDFSVERGIDVTGKLSKGFIPFEGTNKKAFNNSDYDKRTNAFTNNIINSKEKNEILSDLKSFIAILKNKNITPILFSTPCYKEFNSRLNTKITKQNLDDINKICSEFKIEYWDYSTDKRFEKSDFFNSDHLNKFGASKFSKILNSRIEY